MIADNFPRIQTKLVLVLKMWCLPSNLLIRHPWADKGCSQSRFLNRSLPPTKWAMIEVLVNLIPNICTVGFL